MQSISMLINTGWDVRRGIVLKSNQINICLIGKIPQLTQTQKWFT